MTTQMKLTEIEWADKLSTPRLPRLLGDDERLYVRLKIERDGRVMDVDVKIRAAKNGLEVEVFDNVPESATPLGGEIFVYWDDFYTQEEFDQEITDG